MPFVSIAGAAPAGGAIASAIDIARYLITHINNGVAPEGTRVISSSSLSEIHSPGIKVPPDAPNALPAALLGDTIAMHYCLGWFKQTFNDGRDLLWHGGAIDGFGSQMGFFPVERLGYVFLTNLEPVSGAPFHIALQSSLLSRLFGLNKGLESKMARLAHEQATQAAVLDAQTRPADPHRVAPYVGLYTDGFRVRVDDSLYLEHDLRSMPLRAMGDRTYIVADGPGVLATKIVTFEDGADSPRMQIEGFESTRWLTAG
jgi:CubicO group peptidase (beta-lactamase class C family)